MFQPYNFLQTLTLWAMGANLNVATWLSEQALSISSMTLTSKAKFLIPLVRPWKYLQILTLLVMVAIQSYFSYLTIWMSTFQAWYDIDIKRKDISLNG